MNNRIIQTKKGIPLNQAFGAVLMLVLIGVLIIIAIFLFATLGDTFVDTSASTTNESRAWVNSSGYTLANASTCNFNTPSLTTIWGNTPNGSDNYNYSIGLGNATVSSTGVVTNLTEYNVTILGNVSVSYSYLWGGEACTATDTMITQFGNYPVLVGLVGTIIFLGLVIGVLVASFVFGGRGRKGV